MVPTSPPPGPTIPVLYTAACEVCRPRHVSAFGSEDARREVVGTGPHRTHPVTLSTVRSRGIVNYGEPDGD